MSANFKYMRTVKGYIGPNHSYYKIKNIIFTDRFMWADYTDSLDSDNWIGKGAWKLEDIDSLMTTKPRKVKG